MFGRMGGLTSRGVVTMRAWDGCIVVQDVFITRHLVGKG